MEHNSPLCLTHPRMIQSPRRERRSNVGRHDETDNQRHAIGLGERWTNVHRRKKCSAAGKRLAHTRVRRRLRQSDKLARRDGTRVGSHARERRTPPLFPLSPRRRRRRRGHPCLPFFRSGFGGPRPVGPPPPPARPRFVCRTPTLSRLFPDSHRGRLVGGANVTGSVSRRIRPHNYHFVLVV